MKCGCFPETPESCSNPKAKTLYNAAMQKHPLLSVKEAAAILRLDERSVRERLINGQLKGEKKSVGLREKWFVYSGSVEAARSKDSTLADAGFTDVTIESEPFEHDFDPGAAEQPTQEETDENWIELNRDRVKVLAEEIVKPLMEKIEQQAEVIFEQKKTLVDQDRQLKLLPDLQKQAEQRAQEVELRHVENEALKKQAAALQEQLEIARRPWWKKLFESPDV